MQSFIISYFIRKYGASSFIKSVLDKSPDKEFIMGELLWMVAADLFTLRPEEKEFYITTLIKDFLPTHHLQKYPGPRKPKDKEA